MSGRESARASEAHANTCLKELALRNHTAQMPEAEGAALAVVDALQAPQLPESPRHSAMDSWK